MSYDYPAALATGRVQDGFLFASNFNEAAVPGAAATAAYATEGGNGGASMLESAARWVWREVTALERASLGRLRRP